jgi:hypothetical protein
MSPDELRKLMHRFRVSSEKLGKAIGVHPVTVRRWRSGARHPGRGEVRRMMAFFRDLGGEPMPTIDPAEIEPAPINHRIRIEPSVIEPRVDPLPRAELAVPAKASIVEAIKWSDRRAGAPPACDPMPRAVPASGRLAAAVAPIRRDDRGQPADPIAPPPAARQPQIIDAVPLGSPPEPFSAPSGPRCRWPYTATPGAMMFRRDVQLVAVT